MYNGSITGRDRLLHGSFRDCLFSTDCLIDCPQTWVLLTVSLWAVVALLVAYRNIGGVEGSETLADTITKWLFSAFAVLLQEGNEVEVNQVSRSGIKPVIRHPMLALGNSVSIMNTSDFQPHPKGPRRYGSSAL